MSFRAFLNVSWFTLCSLWWIAALTIGIPYTLMLLVSKTFRSSSFSWFYVHIIGTLFLPLFSFPRKEVFKYFKNCVLDCNKNLPINVLEIGIGPGLNFEFYPENCSLIALDKNKFFEPYFVQKVKKFTHINYQRAVIQPAEDMNDIADNSLDVVVSSYLHCSCNDSLAVLKEIQRVLKPRGIYVFLEHVCYPANEFGLYMQRFIKPIWFLFFNGCVLDRDVATKIQSAGFSEVIFEKYISPYFSMYLVRHQIMGVATNGSLTTIH